MALTLYFHPLSSYCQKVLMALYENDTPFTGKLVNLMDPAERADFLKLWPIGKFPIMRDEATGTLIPESTIIIEYLDRKFPGKTKFIPADAEKAHETRLADRFYDLYVDDPMQVFVGNRMRPADQKDKLGEERAGARLRAAYDLIEQGIAGKTWAAGEAFGMADCAAAPALFYAGKVVPFGDGHKNLKAYYERLLARPSFARCVAEAKPYLDMFPKG